MVASDRIRDFLIFALTKMKYDSYKRKTRQTHYTAIFDESCKYLSNKQKGNIAIRTKMNKAALIAKSIKLKRSERNKIIHELASNNASLQRAFLKEQQKWHDKQKEDPSFDVFSDRKGYKSLLENKFELVSNWYMELVEIGDCVFQIEFLSREQA